MSLVPLIIRNQLFYKAKILPVVLLWALFLTLPIASWMFVQHIKDLANTPLKALKTEFILQKEAAQKEAKNVVTQGLIEPFNLNHFPRRDLKKLQAIGEVKAYSSALVLWQLSPKGTQTIVALDPADPAVGLRRIESLLMPGSRFLQKSDANEAIIERHYAKLFGYKKGKTIQVGNTALKIVGVVDFKTSSNLNSAQLFIPYQTALRLAHLKEAVVNQVYVSLNTVENMQKTTQKISAAFPGYALITKDSLYKNLSSFNRLIYTLGDYLVLGVAALSLLLLYWVHRLYRLEFAAQIETLKTLGWSATHRRQWLVWDTMLILSLGVLLSVVFLALFWWGFLPLLGHAPLLDQGLRL